MSKELEGKKEAMKAKFSAGKHSAADVIESKEFGEVHKQIKHEKSENRKAKMAKKMAEVKLAPGKKIGYSIEDHKGNVLKKG